MELDLRRPQSLAVQARQHQAKPVSIPLGTAAWHEFPNGVQPRFEYGDIFLGASESGHPLGIKPAGHIGIIAGTRSGKGVSILVPTLATYPASVVVIDPKGENAILTARRRASGSAFAKGMGQRVYVLDPFGEVATSRDQFADLKASFNPMNLLGASRPESVDDAARIADSIVVSEDQSSDRFWSESARDLIKNVMLHVVSDNEFEPHQRNLVKVRDLILEGYAELHAMLRDNLDGGDAPSAFALMFRAMRKNTTFGREVAKAGERFGQMEYDAPRMLESIAAVALSNLEFLSSEDMQRLVSTSSFEIAELKKNPRGISMYLCLPQRFMETHFRFLRMMITLILAEMERIKGQPRSGHPVLLIMDEFASLHRMRTIENSFAQIAGYGVRMMMVAQSIGQLKTQYKENWTTLLENCSVKVFFGNSSATAEYVSKLCGEVETVRQTSSRNASFGSSSSQAFGETHGSSNSFTSGSSTSLSGGPQGMNYSSSLSSSRTLGTSQGQSETNTFGRNQSISNGESETLHKRPLVTPDEVTRYFGNPDEPKALVLSSGAQPLAINRIAYYQQDIFAGMYDPHPDHPVPPTLAQWTRILRRNEQLRLARMQEEKQRERRRAESLRRNELQRQALERKAEQEKKRFKAWQERQRLEARNQRAKRQKILNTLTLSASGLLVTFLLSQSAFVSIIAVSVVTVLLLLWIDQACWS